MTIFIDIAMLTSRHPGNNGSLTGSAGDGKGVLNAIGSAYITTVNYLMNY
jgi:hypothetical protein